MNPHEPAVRLTLGFTYQATPRGAVHEAHYRVVPLLEELCEFANVRPAPPGMSGDAEQQLMLLWRNARGARSLLAESQELAQMIAKPRQPADQGVV